MLTEVEKMRAERLDIMSGCQRFRELHADEPARTLTATNLANKHGNMLRLRLEDGRLRRPSVQEAAQLQSFPDDARFEPHVISERQAFHGIGNAVPTQLGRHLAEAARKHVCEARGVHGGGPAGHRHNGVLPIPSTEPGRQEPRWRTRRPA